MIFDHVVVQVNGNELTLKTTPLRNFARKPLSNRHTRQRKLLQRSASRRLIRQDRRNRLYFLRKPIPNRTRACEKEREARNLTRRGVEREMLSYPLSYPRLRFAKLNDYAVRAGPLTFGEALHPSRNAGGERDALANCFFCLRHDMKNIHHAPYCT